MESVYYCMDDHSMAFINQTKESLGEFWTYIKILKDKNLFPLLANAAQKNAKNSRILLEDISNEDFFAEIDDIL